MGNIRATNKVLRVNNPHTANCTGIKKLSASINRLLIGCQGAFECTEIQTPYSAKKPLAKSVIMGQRRSLISFHLKIEAISGNKIIWLNMNTSFSVMMFHLKKHYRDPMGGGGR